MYRSLQLQASRVTLATATMQQTLAYQLQSGQVPSQGANLRCAINCMHAAQNCPYLPVNKL